MRKNGPDVALAISASVPSTYLAGILAVVVATAFMSGMDAVAKSLLADLHVMQIVWARAFFGLLLMLPFLLGPSARGLMRTRHPGLQLARAVMYFGANLCFFSALIHLPLADTVAIAFVAPLFITALSVPLLGESVGVRRWSAVVVGLCGALIVIRPGMGVMHWAAIFAVGAAVCYAVFQIITRKIGADDHPATTLLYSNALVMLFATIALPLVWVELSASGWTMMAALGALGTVASFLLIRAYSSTPASVLAPFQYAELVWATALGFVIFGDMPDQWVVLGAVVIAVSGLYTCYRELRPARSNEAA